MATLAIIIDGAIVNALAFTVGNALYDKFEKFNTSFHLNRRNPNLEIN